MNPLVSVIIPVFNTEKYLGAAIESVLNQSYRPLELIVVDDGSTDRSAAIAQNYKETRYLYQRNKGVAVARNTGLAVATGEFIAFLDADDLWDRRKLQIQIDYLREHSSVMYTLSKCKNFLEDGTNIYNETLQSILENKQSGLATIVAHKAIFDQIGGFNPHYKVGEDFEWFTRAIDAGIPMVILPEVLLQRRIHNSNISLTQPQACKASMLQSIKVSLERKRIAANMKRKSRCGRDNE